MRPLPMKSLLLLVTPSSGSGLQVLAISEYAYISGSGYLYYVSRETFRDLCGGGVWAGAAPNAGILCCVTQK